MKRFCFLLLAALLFTSSIPAEASKHKVAIVIDDFGNNMKGTDKMFSLPIPFTAAVMPFLPSTEQDAQKAHERGYEVIIHMPMEPVKGKRSWLGPNAITTDLSNEEIKKRVRLAIQNVPHAVGMNNHMGSKATADERVMRAVLSVCKEYGLYYLDSKTSPNSVVERVAAELHIPTIENTLFFDDVYTASHITKQANHLVQKAKTELITIAIGHVGPPGEITSSVLHSYIPKIQEQADFVFVSSLLPSLHPIPSSR